MPVFTAIAPRLCPCALSSWAYSILWAACVMGAANYAADCRGDASDVGGAFGGEGAFHFGARIGRIGTRLPWRRALAHWGRRWRWGTSGARTSPARAAVS